jgi:hypothetical protein
MAALEGLYRLLSWVLGGFFIYAGIMKLLNPEIFATVLDAFGIVPQSLLMPVCIALPLLEVAAGTGLLLNIKGSLSIITVLMVLFIAVLGYGVWMGLDVDCGCFGPGDPEGEAFHGLRMALYRDLFILGGIAFLFGWRRYRSITPVQLTQVKQPVNGKGTENAYR